MLRELKKCSGVADLVQSCNIQKSDTGEWVSLSKVLKKKDISRIEKENKGK